MHASTCHVAVVHGARGVRFIAVAWSPGEREHLLAEYVRREADRQLAPWTRTTVVDLLERRGPSEAIRVYFDAVGPEWEDERLHLEAVRLVSTPRLSKTGFADRP